MSESLSERVMAGFSSLVKIFLNEENAVLIQNCFIDTIYNQIGIDREPHFLLKIPQFHFSADLFFWIFRLHFWPKLAFLINVWPF